MTSGVYQIRNTINGKVYVGSSVDITARWAVHRSDLKHGHHHSVKLQRAFDKHGADAFEYLIVRKCQMEDLLQHEQHWIDSTDAVGAGYNVLPVAGSFRGRTVSRETREKLSAIARGRAGSGFRDNVVVSAETREKIRASLLGSKLSPDVIAKRTATLKANLKLKPRTPPSDAARQKMRAAKLGIKLSDETRAKMSVSAAAARAVRSAGASVETI